MRSSLAHRSSEMNEAQAYASFDAASQYFLGIPADEFVERFKAGAYSPTDDYPGVVEVLMLAPSSIDLG